MNFFDLREEEQDNIDLMSRFSDSPWIKNEKTIYWFPRGISHKWKDNYIFEGEYEFKSSGERICCQFMTQKFGKDFTAHRPDFLRNPSTGKNFELECFNPDLHIEYRDRSGNRKIVRLAVEYNGIQHYVFPNYVNRDNEKIFHDLLERDKYKMDMCEMEDVYLIVVPYSVSHSMIPAYIEGKLPVDYTIL